MELLIIAYHYFGDEEKYKTGIHPVSPERFKKQLEITGSYYHFISENDLISALQNKKKLPEKCCLVTFDDGLKSQYEFAVPILKKKLIPAVFFISSQPYTDKKAIIVHKIHCLLANVAIETLLRELEIQYRDISERELDWGEIGANKISNWYRFDDEKTGKFKYFLNYYLSPEIANQIVDNIFYAYYPISEEQFCQNLYLSIEELKEINLNSLFSLGLHTHTHFNINGKDKQMIDEDIVKNYEIIRDLVNTKDIYGISFPFGLLSSEEFEYKLNDVLKKLGLLYGVTSHKAINMDFQNPFLLGRFNVNDLPGGKHPIMNFNY